MTSYLDNGYDVMKYFAKFEKFIPHSIIIPTFMTIGSQMPELDRGLFCPPPYRIGSQNTQYKLGLNSKAQTSDSEIFTRSGDFLQIRRKNYVLNLVNFSR